jgi:hypothetical protein
MDSQIVLQTWRKRWATYRICSKPVLTLPNGSPLEIHSSLRGAPAGRVQQVRGTVDDGSVHDLAAPSRLSGERYVQQRSALDLLHHRVSQGLAYSRKLPQDRSRECLISIHVGDPNVHQVVKAPSTQQHFDEHEHARAEQLQVRPSLIPFSMLVVICSRSGIENETIS